MLAPHADDAEFGLGGWLYRLKGEGFGQTKVIVAATGDYTRSDGRLVSALERLREAEAAFRHLLVDDWAFPGWFEENKALETPYARLVQSIATAIGNYQPTELFIPAQSFNQDHSRLREAALTALRPGTHPSIRDVFEFYYPGNCWQAPAIGRCYVELKPEHVQRKIEALDMHRSQFEGRPVAVGPEAARANMRQWGSEVGVEWAEMYVCLREIFRCR